MIFMVSGGFGLPGSGKSLWLARQADRALKGKRLHVGTYDLQSIPGMQYDRIYTNFSFPGAFVLQFETLGLCAYENCLILIDEIMMYADSRDFKSFTPELKHFFSQHRKMHCDVIWVSQMYDDCDKKFAVLRRISIIFDLLSFPALLTFFLLRAFSILRKDVYSQVSSFLAVSIEIFSDASLFSNLLTVMRVLVCVLLLPCLIKCGNF